MQATVKRITAEELVNGVTRTQGKCRVQRAGKLIAMAISGPVVEKFAEAGIVLVGSEDSDTQDWEQQERVLSKLWHRAHAMLNDRKTGEEQAQRISELVRVSGPAEVVRFGVMNMGMAGEAPAEWQDGRPAYTASDHLRNCTAMAAHCAAGVLAEDQEHAARAIKMLMEEGGCSCAEMAAEAEQTGAGGWSYATE